MFPDGVAIFPGCLRVVTAYVVFHGDPLQSSRPHEFKTQIDDPLVCREQIRIYQREAIRQLFYFAFQMFCRYRFEDETDLLRLGSGYGVGLVFVSAPSSDGPSWT